MSHDSSFHLFDVRKYDQEILPEMRSCINREDYAPLQKRLAAMRAQSPSWGLKSALEMPSELREEHPRWLSQYIHATCSLFGEEQYVGFEGGLHWSMEEFLIDESFQTVEAIFEKRLGAEHANLEPWAHEAWGLHGFLRNDELRLLLPRMKSLEIAEEGDELRLLVGLFEKATSGGHGLSGYES